MLGGGLGRHRALDATYTHVSCPCTFSMRPTLAIPVRLRDHFLVVGVSTAVSSSYLSQSLAAAGRHTTRKDYSGVCRPSVPLRRRST